MIALTDPDVQTRRRVYLTDHHAAARAGEALARRFHDSNRDREFGLLLGNIADEIGQDFRHLTMIMETLGIPSSPAKEVVMQIGERLGRLKPNGQVYGYSPVSRLIELDGLCAGIAAKRGLWIALDSALDEDELPDGINLTELVDKASDQLDRLASIRGPIALLALTRP